MLPGRRRFSDQGHRHVYPRHHHPNRKVAPSHRGGPGGFVRVEWKEVWWPTRRRRHHVNDFSGTATIEWPHLMEPGDDSHTGRQARFGTQRIVAGRLAAARQGENYSYPRHARRSESFRSERSIG